MKHSDVEELARSVGAVFDVIANGRHDGIVFTPLELANYTGIVLEKAADQFELQPHVEMFRPSVAEELRAMSAALQSGDRG